MLSDPANESDTVSGGACLKPLKVECPLAKHSRSGGMPIDRHSGLSFCCSAPFLAMRRAQRELPRQGYEVHPVAFLEPPLPDLMLLDMMVSTKADGILIGRLEADSAIALGPYMGAFNC
jgi:hypothetical protein